MRARSPGSVMREREAHVRRVEARGRRLASSGAVSGWFRGCESQVRPVSADVNSPLLEELVARAEHPDAECAE
eukprot:530075-Pyramimonas_sp.AAC.1